MMSSTAKRRAATPISIVRRVSLVDELEDDASSSHAPINVPNNLHPYGGRQRIAAGGDLEAHAAQRVDATREVAKRLGHNLLRLVLRALAIIHLDRLKGA